MDTIEVAADRCDTCGFRAYVYADHPAWASALAFCAHHGTLALPNLLERGATIIDHRDLVTA